MAVTQTPGTAEQARPEPKVKVPLDRGLTGPAKISRIGGGQNLINPVITVTNGREPGYWKAIVLDIFSILSALAFGYTYHRYIIGALASWVPLCVLLLWSTASVIQGFLQKKTSQRFAIICLESLAVVLFFYSYHWEVLLATAAGMAFILFWGYFSIWRELNNSIQLRFFTASGKILGKFVTAAVIFMIVMYASLANQGSFFLSQNGFSQFFAWAAQFVNNFYPNVPLTTSFSDFAQSIAKLQLENNPSFQSLSPADQATTLQQSADQIMGALSPGTSTASSTVASEPTSNAIYNYIVSMLANLRDRFQGAFLGVWGLILFFIVRIIGFVFVWIAQFVALVFYEFLLAIEFMKIGEESTAKEIIQY